MPRITDVLSSVGEQVRQLRIAAELSQTELAGRANIGVATVRRLESGHDVSLGSLIAVARALGRLAWFDDLDPIGPGPSPMELLRASEGKSPRPRRVSRARTPSHTIHDAGRDDTTGASEDVTRNGEPTPAKGEPT
ncbi:helix-turn-helix transcriptional regulator [uncultured Bifidobacterium sp.]|uniref:helix-turn-helix domain-containing protein n=1 Tax=uncultured Bifidobacterium sp. TaxID=165187 RepID=UPI0026224A24|nr:helix-turn-helix transcriptional regulator [uncultured Bifidobacterium sp.]